jgi:hypothetical protein
MPFLGSSTSSRYSTRSGFALPVNLTGHLTIRGAGQDATVLKLSDNCRNLFYIDKQADYDTFRNVTFENFAVDDNGAIGQNHIVCGTVPSNNTPQTRLNLYNLTHRRIRVFGVPDDHTWDATANGGAGQYTMPNTKKAAFGYHSKQVGDYEAGTTPGALPLRPWPGITGATAAKWNYVIGLRFEDVHVSAAQRAILVVSDITQNSSIWYDDIILRRCTHEQTNPWEGWAPQTSFYVGGNCQGGTALIEDCTSVNVGDDGIEFGGLQQLTVRNFKVVNPILNGILVRYSQPPVESSTVRILVDGFDQVLTAGALNNDTITRSDGSTGRRSLRARPFEIKTENDAAALTLGQVVIRNARSVIEGGYHQSLNRSSLLGWNSSGPVAETILENIYVALQNFTLDFTAGEYLIDMFSIRPVTGETGGATTTRVKNAHVLIDNITSGGARYEFHGITPQGGLSPQTYAEVDVDGFTITAVGVPSTSVVRMTIASPGWLPTAYSTVTTLNRLRLRGLKGIAGPGATTVRRGILLDTAQTVTQTVVDDYDGVLWASTADISLGASGAVTNGLGLVIGSGNRYQSVANGGRRNPQAANYTLRIFDCLVAVTSTDGGANHHASRAVHDPGGTHLHDRGRIQRGGDEQHHRRVRRHGPMGGRCDVEGHQHQRRPTLVLQQRRQLGARLDHGTTRDPLGPALGSSPRGSFRRLMPLDILPERPPRQPVQDRLVVLAPGIGPRRHDPGTDRTRRLRRHHQSLLTAATATDAKIPANNSPYTNTKPITDAAPDTDTRDPSQANPRHRPPRSRRRRQWSL